MIAERTQAQDVLDRLTALGWTTKDIGFELGIWPNAVGNWIAGRKRPTREHVDHLERLLRMDPEDIPRAERMARIGESAALIHVLKERGWPNSQLAKRLNVSTALLHSYMREENQPHRKRPNPGLLSRLRALMEEQPPRTAPEVVLYVLGTLADENHLCGPTYADLSERTGYSLKHIYHVLRQLEAKRVIDRLYDPEGDKRRPVYRVRVRLDAFGRREEL